MTADTKSEGEIGELDPLQADRQAGRRTFSPASPQHLTKGLQDRQTDRQTTTGTADVLSGGETWQKGKEKNC